jgi:hypothetical protein
VLAMLSRKKIDVEDPDRTERAPLAADANHESKRREVEEQAGIIRAQLRSVAETTSSWVNDSSQRLVKQSGEPQSIVDARTGRCRADRLLRAAAGIMSAVPESDDRPDATLQLRLLDLHNMLAWQSQRTIDDFWGPADPSDAPFFEMAAGRYQEAANELCRAATGQARREDRSDSPYKTRVEAARGWAELSADPITLVEGDDEPELRHAVSVTLKPSLPPGHLAFWLENASQATLAMRELDRPDFGRRMTVSTEAGAKVPLKYGLRRQDLDSSGSIVHAVALFRGHLSTDGVAVEQPKGIRIENIRPENPRTTVRVWGQSAAPGAVMLILDCSGSMSFDTTIVEEGNRVTRTRFDVARTAFENLLTELVASKHYRIGIRFYGHRVGFHPETNAIRKQLDWARASGKPIPDIQPGEDAEDDPFRPIGRLGPPDLALIKEQTKSLKPWGITPLYLTLVRCLSQDFRGIKGDVPRSIVVITDGVNDQAGTRGPAITDIAAVESACKNNDNVRVFMVGFELSASEAAKASPHFERIKAASNGDFTFANNAEELAEALKKLIPNQYAVFPSDSAPPQPKDPGWVELDRQYEFVNFQRGRIPRKASYTVQIKNPYAEVKSDLELEGGESIELDVSEDGKKLQHRLFKESLIASNSNEERVRGIPDPMDAKRQFRIGIHMPRRLGTAVSFPVSIQNADWRQFSPRPAEAWVEITPVLADGPDASGKYCFYDMVFEPDRPVPVLNCVAPEWPSTAEKAQLRIWFKMARTNPARSPRIRELARNPNSDIEISGIPGITFRVQAKPPKNPDGDYAVIVTEQHPRNDPEFHSAKVEVYPPANRSTHSFNREAGKIIHTFYFSKLQEHEVLDDHELRVTSHSKLKDRAIEWQTSSPIAIPGKGELKP